MRALAPPRSRVPAPSPGTSFAGRLGIERPRGRERRALWCRRRQSRRRLHRPTCALARPALAAPRPRSPADATTLAPSPRFAGADFGVQRVHRRRRRLGCWIQSTAPGIPTEPSSSSSPGGSHASAISANRPSRRNHVAGLGDRTKRRRVGRLDRLRGGRFLSRPASH